MNLKKLLVGLTKKAQARLPEWLMVLLLMTVVIIPGLLPLFKPGFFRMHDFTHVARLVELDQALKDGHLPPRWSKNLGWGYGMPLFHFYAPLPYFLAEIFYLTTGSAVLAIKLVFGLTFWLAFGGMFWLVKRFWGKSAGFLAAAALVYSPYRALDFYVRGALGELLAISLIPWVIWAVVVLLDRDAWKKTVVFGGILGLFLLTHTILNLVCLPLFVLVAGFYWLLKGGGWSSLIKLIAGFGLGFGLAAFFILPAFVEKQFTQVDKLTSGYSHYSHHFLYFRQLVKENWGYGGSIAGLKDGISFHLGKIQLGLVLASLALIAVRVISKRQLGKQEKMAGFFIGLTGLLMWLTTYHAQPVWDQVSLMAYIQFPWRLLSFIIVLIGFLSSAWLSYLERLGLGRLVVKLGVGLAVVLLVGVNWRFFRPEKYGDTAEFYYSDPAKIKTHMSGVIPDYLPKGVKERPEAIQKQEYELVSGQAEVEVLADKTDLVKLRVEAEEPVELQINRFYFPGWKAFVDQQPVVVADDHPQGLMIVAVPAGDHQLTVKLTKTRVQRLAEGLTVFSIIGGGLIYGL